ncbi:MAG: leucine-rich repeat protein [Ruminococcus sp.]|nr:leucine-rich repeat protein [Ruminococcus sp.]
MSDPKEMNIENLREGKGVWDYKEPVEIDNIKYGKKTFLTEKNPAYCAREIICRYYLNDKKINNITKFKQLVKVISENGDIDDKKTIYLNEYIYVMNIEKIHSDFSGQLEGLKNKISDLKCYKIILYIEIAEPVKEIFEKKAKNFENNKSEIESQIKKLFEIIAVLHENNVVHSDLKPGNIFYKEQNEELTMLLNDFDTSFVIKHKNVHYDNNSVGSVPYTTPELLGMFNRKISCKTDIFMAGLICYQLLNDNNFPKEFGGCDKKLKNDRLNCHYGETEAINEIKALFRKLKKRKKRFSKPAHGEKAYVKAVMKALSIDPNDRPSAQDILKILNGKKTQHTPWFISLIVIVVLLGFLFFYKSGDKDITGISVADNSGANSEITASSVIDTETSEKSEIPTAAETIASTQKETETQNTSSIASSISKASENSTAVTASHHTDKNTGTIVSEEHIEDEPSSEPETLPPSEITTFATETAEISNNALKFKYTTTEIDGGENFANVSGVKITGFNGELSGNLIIPDHIDSEKVISIGEDAFCGSNIRSLTIPDTVYEINARAFRNCAYLSSIYLGKNVIIIGEQAFYRTQFLGDDMPTITITNLNHGNDEAGSCLGKQWAGRENDDYIINYYY